MPENKFVIPPDAQPATAAGVCFAYFGIPLPELARDIALHPEKYTSILADEKVRATG